MDEKDFVDKRRIYFKIYLSVNDLWVRPKNAIQAHGWKLFPIRFAMRLFAPCIIISFYQASVAC